MKKIYQRQQLTIPEHETNDAFDEAIRDGELFLFKGHVTGFGVRIYPGGICIPDEPTTRADAEAIQAKISGQFPEAEVIRQGMPAEYVSATQEPMPGDYFHISYVSETKPGEWGTHTDLRHHTYKQAIQKMEVLWNAGYSGVTLLRIRADEPVAAEAAQ
ncbi:MULTISPECIES: hypothetical protein [unclassified Marinobacter]|jgi:hypothetical protein|uniref:hypothetical protein n=1 Tax=unclassified Marinobacter TaxID=83889 RepID=UPI000C8A6B20|nr:MULTISPECIES: hypothetical protein [unclassified Marinobacter]MAK49372.1 hypothetical protein [Marinobacter sp.]|tara:strand:+ start:254 stop:730 length:477 start_codon:yes stop_codon:yes gene_type:complete